MEQPSQGLPEARRDYTYVSVVQAWEKEVCHLPKKHFAEHASREGGFGRDVTHFLFLICLALDPGPHAQGRALGR